MPTTTVPVPVDPAGTPGSVVTFPVSPTQPTTSTLPVPVPTAGTFGSNSTSGNNGGNSSAGNGTGGGTVSAFTGGAAVGRGEGWVMDSVMIAMAAVGWVVAM